MSHQQLQGLLLSFACGLTRDLGYGVGDSVPWCSAATTSRASLCRHTLQYSLSRLYQGSVKALLRLYQGSIMPLLRQLPPEHRCAGRTHSNIPTLFALPPAAYVTLSPHMQALTLRRLLLYTCHSSTIVIDSLFITADTWPTNSHVLDADVC